MSGLILRKWHANKIFGNKMYRCPICVKWAFENYIELKYSLEYVLEDSIVWSRFSLERMGNLSTHQQNPWELPRNVRHKFAHFSRGIHEHCSSSVTTWSGWNDSSQKRKQIPSICQHTQKGCFMCSPWSTALLYR